MAHQPILPSNPADPTGQDRRERGAIAEFSRRLRDVRLLYVAALNAIPSQVIQVNADVTQYNITPEALSVSLDEVGRQVDRLLLENDRGDLWFTEAAVEPAYQQGAAQQLSNLSVQSAAYAASRPNLTALLTSQPYRTRLGFLKVRVADTLRGYTEGVKSHMSQILQDGLAAGRNARDVARRMADQIGIEYRRAERIARTEIPNALRQARLEEAQQATVELGLLTREMHMSALSPTTRPSHRARHGKLYTVQEQREWWSIVPNMINCYLPGTRVSGRFVGGSKARYEGPALDLVVTGGADLSVTPNHPLMTPFGLVAAAELRKGDYLIRHRVQVENAPGVAALHSETADALIEDVFASLSELFQPSQAWVGAVDFHGDASFMQEQIDIVRANRMLPVAIDAHRAQVLDEFSFVHADSVRLLADRSSASLVEAVGSTSDSFVGSGSIGQSLLPAHVGRACESALTSVTSSEASLSEPAHNYRTRDSQLFAELLDRYAGEVELVQIMDIRSRQFSGHVYDLEEESGLMVANGLIASNCKCSTVTVLVDENGKPLTPGVIDRARAMLEKNPAPA